MPLADIKKPARKIHPISFSNISDWLFSSRVGYFFSSRQIKYFPGILPSFLREKKESKVDTARDQRVAAKSAAKRE